MNDPLENQTVIDFVLESEKNLDAAVRMARAFPAAQRIVAGSMLDLLEKKMRGELGLEWEIRNPKDELFKMPYPSFTLACKAWRYFYLNLQNQTREGRTVVGIGRERRPQTDALDDGLARAFGAAGQIGGTHKYWAWYKVLPAECGDWNNASALAAMRLQTEESLQFFASELMSLHQLAAPIIEEFFASPAYVAIGQ